MSDSEAGELYQRCLQIKYRMKEGYRQTLQDVTLREYRGVQVLSSEYERHQAELSKPKE